VPELLHVKDSKSTESPQALYLRIGNLVGLAVLAACLSIIVAIAYRHWRDNAIDASSASVDGHIVKLYKSPTRRGYSFDVDYRYQVNSQSYAGSDVLDEGVWDRLTTGQLISISYLASQPGICRARVAKPVDKTVYMECEAMMSFFFVLGCAVVWQDFRKQRAQTTT
jgi:hypothetical protein